MIKETQDKPNQVVQLNLAEIKFISKKEEKVKTLSLKTKFKTLNSRI